MAEVLSIVSLIVSGIALLISFYFNLHSAHINRFNKFNDYIADMDKIIIDNPDLIHIYNNDEIDKRKDDCIFMNKIIGFIYLHFNVFENAWVQFISKKSPATKKQKNVWINYITILFKTELVNEIWKSNKNLYDKDFVKFINNLIIG